MNKTCPTCKESKPVSEFYKDKHASNGLRSCCKPCSNAKSSEHHEKNRPRRLIQMRAWHYDITAEELTQKELNQSDGCKICSAKTNGRISFHVDHDHITGVVRDLLCTRCNTLIGFSHGEPDVLRKAADYLDRWNASSARKLR